MAQHRPEYAVSDKPLGAQSSVRVACVGAGASGIALIKSLKTSLKHVSITVYEKNEHVGGTWFENRYPGCRCDIPSHSYQFSWRQNREWSNFHACSDEIREYLHEVAEEEGMMEQIKTSHQVVGARWVEERGVWLIRIRNCKDNKQFDDEAEFFVNATGILK